MRYWVGIVKSCIGVIMLLYKDYNINMARTSISALGEPNV